jgi:hypothetical protein
LNELESSLSFVCFFDYFYKGLHLISRIALAF